MKLVNTLSVIGVALSLSLNAQVSQDSPVQPTDAKTTYIKNQEYMQPSSVHNDSLLGFNEQLVRNELLRKGLGIKEATGHMNHLKRKFIQDKYHIGQAYSLPQLPLLITPKNGGSGSTNGGSGKQIGGGSSVNVYPCVNEGFESSLPGAYSTSNAVTGWTIYGRSADGACNPSSGWTPGSPEFSLVGTPIINFPNATNSIGIVPHSPLGGTLVARMNDDVNDYQQTKLVTTFSVTNANTLFQFAYAGYYQDPGHGCCDQPGINFNMFNCAGQPLSCSSLSLFPGCSSSNVTYTSIPNTASWSNWQVKYVDLTPFIGSCVTIEVMTTDCSFGGHWGSTLFDAICGGQLIGIGLGGQGGGIAGPVSFCAGSNQAIISAPLGYSSYQWVSPTSGTIAPPAGTMANLVVQNPIPGSVFTVNLVSASGCQYIATNTIVFSSVNVAGIGSSSTCPNGSSGSATVQGNGSGTGYNYSWYNSTGSVVGTQSVVNGLAPGVYSVVLTGLGSAGCGSAAATTTVGVASPSVTQYFKPYCGSEAYLGTTGGTNYRWYNGTTLITSTLGTLPNYTVTTPCNGCIWWLSYTTPQGCKDSVKFTLVQSQPGFMTVPPNQIKLICPGANNGTASINMVPAANSPGGLNFFSVAATGTTAPYSYSIYPTALNTITVGGLSQGTYTVNTFDGSCKYTTTFNVLALIYDFTVTPNSPTLCPGNSIPAGITFTSLPQAGQYSYSWTPTNWLVGGNGSLQNTIITPTGIPMGSVVTTVYTVQVTPTIAICPKTKTISITAVNPPTPTITPIANMCNNFAPVQITVSPTGGTFINASNTPTLVNSLGIITPSAGTIGSSNTFTYSISVNTCVARNTATFQINQFRTAALTASVPALCVTNPAFNLMNIVQSTVNGSWSGAQGVQSNQFVPSSINFNNTYNLGNYTSAFTVTYNTVSNPNPTVCPQQSVLNITVTNTMIPTITQLGPICNNQSPINMTVTPPGGGWSGPNISTGGIITPTNISSPGTSFVTYTVTNGPCLNTAGTSFNVHKFNPAKITLPIPELCVSSNPFNLMGIVASTVSGTWSGPGVFGNQFSPSTFSTSINTLTYNTVSTPPLASCADVATTTVSVLNPPTPNIIQVGPFCSKGAAIQLSVSPNTGSWTATSFLSQSGVFSPSLGAVGNNPVQYVIGTPTCFAQSTKFISVEAFVPATITTPKLPDLCNNGSAVNLVPFTLTNLGSWLGTGISGTSFNPALTGMGTFTLTHKTASSPSGLCPDQATVAVSVFSLQTPTIKTAGNVDRVCNLGTPLQLIPDVQGGLFGGVNNFGVSSAGLFVPSSGVIGENIISYSITSGPCVAYAQTTINVERFVPADLALTPKEFCRTDERVNLNSFVLHGGGTWSTNDSQKSLLGSMFDPRHGNSGGNNTFTYTTHSMPTPTLCPDTSSIRIVVNDVPVVTPLAYAEQFCSPEEVIFTIPNFPENEGESEWNFGDGSEPQKGNRLTHIYTTPGVYNVQLSFRNKGCTARATIENAVTVHESPKVDFSLPEEVLISNPEIQLTNLSTVLANNKYTWKITGLNDRAGEVHPRISFPKIGKYQVTLLAENEFGCKSELTKTLEVKNDFNIYIPTSFSPNFDRLNDEFKPVFSPYGLDLKSYEMEIFDRWGHAIYRTKDVNEGWNGRIDNKGEPMKEEVYIYRIKYKDLDGNSYNKMGHVSLIK